LGVQTRPRTSWWWSSTAMGRSVWLSRHTTTRRGPHSAASRAPVASGLAGAAEAGVVGGLATPGAAWRPPAGTATAAGGAAGRGAGAAMAFRPTFVSLGRLPPMCSGVLQQHPNVLEAGDLARVHRPLHSWTPARTGHTFILHLYKTRFIPPFNPSSTPIFHPYWQTTTRKGHIHQPELLQSRTVFPSCRCSTPSFHPKWQTAT